MSAPGLPLAVNAPLVSGNTPADTMDALSVVVPYGSVACGC